MRDKFAQNSGPYAKLRTEIERVNEALMTTTDAPTTLVRMPKKRESPQLVA